MPLGGPYIRFPLPEGNEIEIRLRAKVTPAVFQTIKQLLELSEESLVRAEPSDVEPVRLRRVFCARGKGGR